MHTDVFQNRNSIFIQLFLPHLPFEIIIMRHSHNIEKIFEKEKKKKGNSSVQSTAEVYDVKNYFYLAAKRKVFHLHCLYCREPLFEIEKNTSTYRQQNCNLHMQETKTK